MSGSTKFGRWLPLLFLALWLSLSSACSDSGGAISLPQGDEDNTSEQEGSGDEPEIALEMIIRGTGTTEGNPAIVVIGFGERPTDPKIERKVEWTRVNLRISGAFLASSEHCDTDHGSVLRSHSGTFDFSLVGSETKRIRMFTEPTLEYCSLDFSLEESGDALILEGEHKNGSTRSLHTALNGQLPFAPVGGRFLWDESAREHWIVVLDPRKLPEDDEAESLSLDEESNPVLLQQWREAFVGALAVYRDLDENGQIDENELNEDNLVALGDPTRLNAAWSSGNLAPIPSDSDGVFVAPPPLGSDDAPGTMQEPVATIGRGVELAGFSKAVFVAEGEYPESVLTMASLYGGYEAATWTRDLDAHTTVIAAHMAENAEFGLQVYDIASANLTVHETVSNRRITIQGFSIVAPVGGGDIETTAGISVLNNTWTVLADNLVRTASSTTYGHVVGIQVAQYGDSQLLRNRVVLTSAESGEGVILGENVTVRLEDNLLSFQNNSNEVGVRTEAPHFVSLRRNFIVSTSDATDSTLLYVANSCTRYENCRVEAANNRFIHTALCGADCPMVEIEEVPCIFSNNVFSGTGSAGSLLVELRGQKSVVAANNVFQIFPSEASEGTLSVFKTGSAAQLTSYHNLFHLPDQAGVVFVQDASSTTHVDSVAALNACAWENCVSAGGNLAGDPLLVDAENGDFHLQPNSPCIDSGMDPLLAGIRLWSDADGVVRPQGDGFDIGAFEYDGNPSEHECPEVVNACERRPSKCIDNAIALCQEHYDAFGCLISTDYEDSNPTECGNAYCFDEPPSGVSAEIMAICMEECTPCETSDAVLCLPNAGGGCRQWDCVDGCRTLALDSPDNSKACGGEDNLYCMSETLCGPVLSITPDGLIFGCVAVGSTAQKPVTLRNIGSGDLTIYSVVLRNNGWFDIRGPDLPVTIPVSGSLTFYVSVSPDSIVPRDNEIQVLSSDCEWPFRTIYTLMDCDDDPQCYGQPEGAACDDGSVCTMNDACTQGMCVGTPVVCDDFNPCTDDSCNEAGGCIHINNHAACDVGNPCAFGECRNGECFEVPTENCNDDNPCTEDTCDLYEGCLHMILPNGSVCAPESVCMDGNCVGNCTNDEDCEDSHACTEDVCNLDTGACLHIPDPAACDDGYSCTVDSCDPLNGCLHVYDASLCSGNLCPTATILRDENQQDAAPQVVEVLIGQGICLYGAGIDEDGTLEDPRWELVGRPEGSQAELTIVEENLHEICLTPDVMGDYKLSFTLRDDDGCRSEPAEITVRTVDEVRWYVELTYYRGENFMVSSNLIDVDLSMQSPDGYRCSEDTINSLSTCSFPNGCGTGTMRFDEEEGAVTESMIVNGPCEGSWLLNVTYEYDCNDWVDIFAIPFCASHTDVGYSLKLFHLVPYREEPMFVTEGVLDTQGEQDSWAIHYSYGIWSVSPL